MYSTIFIDKLPELVTNLQNTQIFAFDIETTSLKTHSESLEILGIGFSWKKGEATYLQIRDSNEEAEALRQLYDVFADESIGKIGHNIKYDARVLLARGLKVNGIVFDTMIANYCLVSDRTTHNLDDLTLHYLNYVKVRTKSLIPNKSKKYPNPSLKDADQGQVATYCCEDVDSTFRLYKRLTQELLREENEAARNIFYTIEMPVTSVLLKMEHNGVKIDTDKLDELLNKLQDKISASKSIIDTETGREVVLTNPNDIATAIYDDLKIHEQLGVKIKTTPTGKRSTAATMLDQMADHEVVSSILLIKKYNKLISTYILALPEKISSLTGYLHAYFNQHITATGRLSSSDPNLQNIPARDEEGKEIRGAFVSRWEGGKILSADYSQAELRILAHMSQEPVLLDVYRRGEDAHRAVAARTLQKTTEKVTSKERDQFKTVNYGIIYGMGSSKLAAELGIDRDTSTQIITDYLNNLPHVKRFIETTKSSLVRHGYTETLYKRKRYIPSIYSQNTLDQWAAQRAGFNHTIQGTNADIIKLAMIQINDWLHSSNLKSLMIMQVHDEIVIDVHPDEIEFIKDKVIDVMESCVCLDIPMIADGNYADSWADAH
jgi:DNA polymerase-1